MRTHNASAIAPVLIALAAWGCSTVSPRPEPAPRAVAPERAIAVDGDPADWQGIPAQEVRGERHLWFGQGMVRENWLGDRDLGYRWRAAWKGRKLFFLFEVTDDRVLEPTRPSSFLNDCVELYLDPAAAGGPRVAGADQGGALRGREIHFLPTDPPRVFLDHEFRYALDHPQTETYRTAWAGEAACRRTAEGYVLEMGFAKPGLDPRPGLALGIETGVCDDDGAGRKSILMWTGTKGDFWVTMDGYGRLVLEGPGPAGKP